MDTLLEQIRADLKGSADAKTQQTFQRFFKEQVKYYGVKTNIVAKIAEKFWPQVQVLSKAEIFGLCENLFASGITEEAFVVSNWLPNYIAYLQPEDLATLKRWIESYVDNWAKCDGLCNHTVGDLIQKYPQILPQVKAWAKSQNRWLKRASAVSLIVPAKRGMFLQDAFEICDVLLLDGDDLVQKGYGWLLKEESRLHQREVFDYVLRNRDVMPRTALRYAIELMPKTLRTQAMAKS
jgi:3-methyladenine DNA glycosylase AlkD